MIVSLKPGVSLRGLRVEMSIGLAVVASIFTAKGVPLMVTSALDGTHKAASNKHPRSLHYEGLALDIRLPSRYTNHIQDDEIMAGAMRQALTPEFDVILESDHIHFEYDPKSQPVV